MITFVRRQITTGNVEMVNSNFANQVAVARKVNQYVVVSSTRLKTKDFMDDTSFIDLSRVTT